PTNRLLFQVARFLNRILGLRIVCQHIVFDYFHAVMEVCV
ncbi:unnamed protein product, partial [Hapterophycus canaliculatus]